VGRKILFELWQSFWEKRVVNGIPDLLRLIGRASEFPWITHYGRASTYLTGTPVQLTGATSVFKDSKLSR